LAVLLAFAGGTLTAALAFELFEESFTQGGRLTSALGLSTGALVFVVIDVVLDRRVERAGGDSAGFLLLAAVVLDGIPENLALGTTLVSGGGSIALLAAIFASNFPEALVGARNMCEDGLSVRYALGTWCAAAVLLAAAIVVGAGLLQDVPSSVLSVILAFAGGAVLASLADTVFPKAYEEGGPWVALATVAGFLLAFTLGTVG
jgi:ZIP family zinc transporter